MCRARTPPLGSLRGRPKTSDGHFLIPFLMRRRTPPRRPTLRLARSEVHAKGRGRTVRVVAFYPIHGRARLGPPPPPVFFTRPQTAGKRPKKASPGRPRCPWGGPAWPHVHGTAGSTDRHPAGRPRKRISGLRDYLLRRTGCNGRKAASSRFYECALAQDTRLYVVDLSHHLSVWPHDL